MNKRIQKAIRDLLGVMSLLSSFYTVRMVWNHGHEIEIALLLVLWFLFGLLDE